MKNYKIFLLAFSTTNLKLTINRFKDQAKHSKYFSDIKVFTNKSIDNFLKSNLEDYNISHVQNIPKNLRFDPVIFESPIPKYADKIDKISLEIILMKKLAIGI